MVPTLLASQGSITAIFMEIISLALIWKILQDFSKDCQNNISHLKIDLLPAENGAKTLENKESSGIYVAVYA